MTDMPPDDYGAKTTAAAALSMEALFARYGQPLQAFFGKRVGYEEAEEYTQETFLRFSQASYDTAAKDAGALLFTIAANLFRDHLRRLRRERAFGMVANTALDDEEVLSVPSDTPLPDASLENRQELERALVIIECLPPRCAAVFLMHRLQGKSHRAIAEELGISISMVEKHIKRAVEGLLAALAKPDKQ
jgi:RNA polymerase sigma-70 factor (ECF subfamily)